VARDRPVARRDHFRPGARGSVRPFGNPGVEQDGDNETIEMVNPFEFIQQVRAEANKVTWPTRRETLITTGLVLVMVVIAAIFFTVVDQALRLIVTFILSLGR
jgi:preprotein translocase subunit SecE